MLWQEGGVSSACDTDQQLVNCGLLMRTESPTVGGEHVGITEHSDLHPKLVRTLTDLSMKK